jgi:hypothetical protein
LGLTQLQIIFGEYLLKLVEFLTLCIELDGSGFARFFRFGNLGWRG